MYPKKSNKKLLFAIPLLLLAAGATILILELSGTINLYNKQDASTNISTSDEYPTESPTNTIDYGPASPNDNVPIPDKDPSAQTPNPANTELSATITSTRKNSAGDRLLIKVAVQGTESGTCKATLTQGTKTVTANGIIELSSGQYSCSGLEPLLSELGSGEWNISISVKDTNGAETVATSTVII